MQTSPFAKNRASSKANDCGIQIDNVRMARSSGQTPGIERTGNFFSLTNRDMFSGRRCRHDEMM